MSAPGETFTATLQKSQAKGGWTYVVMPGSAEPLRTDTAQVDALHVPSVALRSAEGWSQSESGGCHQGDLLGAGGGRRPRERYEELFAPRPGGNGGTASGPA